MEMFRRATTQPSSLANNKIVSADETESVSATYSEVVVLNGVTWTIASGVTISTGAFTNYGTLENNGTLEVSSGTGESTTASKQVELFKVIKQRSFVEVYP